MMKLKLLLAISLATLSGCSVDRVRFPWNDKGANQQADDYLYKDISAPNTAPSPGKSSLLLGLPPLLTELPPSGLQPLSQAVIDQCAKLIGIPAEETHLADKTNYGERIRSDAWRRPVASTPQLIVLHETVINQSQTIDLFKTPHQDDAQQVSYHLLIGRDGSLLRIVPDRSRAYGAGMSAFGDVTQRLKPGSVGSINNIALHVSLVSPSGSSDELDTHSGYSQAQYKSLAAQVLLWQAMYGIPLTRVTTHASVDRSHSRYDPRSFRWDIFDVHYRDASRQCGFERFDNKTAGL